MLTDDWSRQLHPKLAVVSNYSHTVTKSKLKFLDLHQNSDLRSINTAQIS